MSKRARWNGDEPVHVTWPPGEVYPTGSATVVPGGLLPEDAPASTRDELIANVPGWSEVKQDAKPKTEEKK
jgi:hypothetical protein